jgi:hypothetical protein
MKETPLPGPLIAIAGSADPERADYQPPVDVEAARAAGEQLGTALAKAGCRIMVYSSKSFMEAHVVRGFAAAEPKTSKAIQVRFPAGSTAANFPEHQAYPDLFEFQADPHAEWEVSYYRSLREADSVLLIGGGQAILITGHLAIAYRIPLLALGTFGGAAYRVWQAITPDQDLASKEDRNLMGQPQWSGDRAAICVHSLLDQHERRLKELAAERQRDRDQARETRNRSSTVSLLVLLTLAMLATGLGWGAIGHLWFQVLLLFSGALAGAAGATVRLLWTREPDQSTARSVALGLGAGAISSVLYIATQIAANPALLGTAPASEPPRPLLLFAVVIGFIAGFTFDAVYRKLAETDVTHTGAVAVKKP